MAGREAMNDTTPARSKRVALCGDGRQVVTNRLFQMQPNSRSSSFTVEIPASAPASLPSSSHCG